MQVPLAGTRIKANIDFDLFKIIFPKCVTFYRTDEKIEESLGKMLGNKRELLVIFLQVIFLDLPCLTSSFTALTNILMIYSN